MASPGDILSALKNGVVNIATLTQYFARAQGTVTSATVTASTLVVSGNGYLVNFAVVVAGTGAGAVYNSASTGSTPAAGVICATPTTLGVYQCGQVFTNGLVIVPGTGQSVNVTYYLTPSSAG